MSRRPLIEANQFVHLGTTEPAPFRQLVQAVPVVAVHGDERIKVHQVSVAWPV